MEQAPQPISAGAEFAQFITVMSTLENHVKEWYNVDFFIMLRQQQGLANMTATAIGALQGEQVALLAALVSNLFEGLNKIVQRTFDILAKKKLLPTLPFALQQMGGSLKVDFIGVLAQAQKMAYEYSNIQAALGIAGQYNEFGKVDPTFTHSSPCFLNLFWASEKFIKFNPLPVVLYSQSRTTRPKPLIAER